MTIRRVLLVSALVAWGGSASGADFYVYEANYPGVCDYNVAVDSAALTIRPQGAFIEMELQLAVSYAFRSWFFKNYTELEFRWDFSLPDHAVVDDFALWVGDTLLQAAILDRWTAELLFSEVSSPVRNPGLLTQGFPDREGQVSHSVRIFPVMRGEKRRFRIHYLLPARPTAGKLRVWLPISQLTSRRSPGADTLHVRFYGEQAPTLIGAEPCHLSLDTRQGTWNFSLPLRYDSFVELAYPNPMSGPFFFSSYQDSLDSFYQLTVLPPVVAQERVPRNFLVIVDFNRFNTSGMDGELLLLWLKETMQQALTEGDSANIIVGYADPVIGADRLLACSEQNLDLLFSRVMQRSFPSYSSFQVLMDAAAQLLNGRYDSTDVILFTNTDEIALEGEPKEWLADTVVAMFSPGTKIHIVDLDNVSSLVYNYRTSQYETQLQSFFARICYQSGGNLFFLRYHSISNILAALFYERITHYEEVEVQTRFASGYAFGKHLRSLHEGYYPFGFPLMQVGRYRGTLPLEVTLVGKVRFDKIIERFDITEQDVAPGTVSLARAWYGDHIHAMLRRPQTNATVVEIMDLSLKQRILTPYSGLLVFQPGENHGYEAETSTTPSPPEGGGWEGPATEVDSARVDSVTLAIALTAYPNPFNQTVRLTLALPAQVREVSLVIYNSLGQQVRRMALPDYLPGCHELVWDGRDDQACAVGSGVYLAVLSTEKARRSLKLLVVR